jgi:hypothetical protein
MMVGCDLNVGINPRLQPSGPLDPQTILVDERTLVDRLSFAAKYGELIVFFDQHNQPNGDWRGFALKDPLILMAAISTTAYTPTHRLFLLLKDKLGRARADWDYETLKTNPPEAPVKKLLAQLVELINQLFADINDWLQQMDIGHKSYALRSFVRMQVENQHSGELAQLVELQKLVYVAFFNPELGQNQVQDFPAPDYGALEDYNSLWRTANFSSSLSMDIQGDTLVIDVDVLQRFEQIYHGVFGFYVQVIDSAKDSFTELWQGFNQSSDGYADTSMLVAFAQLMQVQQTQLNQLTDTHLNFYYRDILAQTQRVGTADSAIVCLGLKPDALALLLPQGTVFDGGVDANQQPQQFVNGQSQWINLIQIGQLQTLRYQDGLWLNVITDGNKVVKDPQGQLRSWPLLGTNEGSNQGKALRQGLALASPMLSLSGGTRTITLTIHWAAGSSLTIDEMQGSDFYLSTEADWLAVSPIDKDGIILSTDSLILTFELSPTDPPIVPLAENPDGYSSDWPLFKWLPGDQLDLTEPATMSTLDISVEVEDFHDAQLHSDDALLSADAPFLPFGPIVDKGGRFYLGSAELFAKPLSVLQLKVKWDQLPSNMKAYYQTYNQYRNGQFDTINMNSVTEVCKPFNDLAFKATFSLFKDSQWQAVSISNSLPTQPKSEAEPADGNEIETEPKPVNPVPLFNQIKVNKTPDAKDSKGAKCPVTEKQTSPDSLFSFTKEALKCHTPTPDLLLAPLDFAQPLKTGFIRLQVATPEEGFGNSLYAKVVTAVTQENAYRLIMASKECPPIVVPEVATQENKENNKADGDSGKADAEVSAKSETKTEDSLLTKIVSIFDKSDKSDKGATVATTTDADTAMTLIPMPNLPYAPKISALSLVYHASQTVNFTTTTTADYPCELFHYDSFSAYPVYGTTTKTVTPPKTAQSPGMISQKNTLVPGIAAGGCLYLALTHIQPPCNLSLYFRLNHLVASSIGSGIDNAETSLKFYYLGNEGWGTLSILADATNGLQCSGIIEVLVPTDISQDPTLLPFDKPADATTGTRGWLAITGAGDICDYAQVVYLNSQAVQVTRHFEQPWTASEAPTLAADSIAGLVVATLVEEAAVEEIVQPFAGGGGQGMENNSGFYRRVSERVGNKDRVVSHNDFATLAYQRMPRLYYCKVIKAQQRKKPMQLMLVNGYEEADADAFKPVVNGCELKHLQQFFARRVSPMVGYQLMNPDYEAVKVTVTLRFAANVAIKRLCQQMDEQLKIYLSPWITSTLAQRTVDQDLTSGELIDFFSQWSEVTEVGELSITVNEVKQTNPFVVVPQTDHSLLISASAHCISQDTTQQNTQVGAQ